MYRGYLNIYLFALNIIENPASKPLKMSKLKISRSAATNVSLFTVITWKRNQLRIYEQITRLQTQRSGYHVFPFQGLMNEVEADTESLISI